VVVAYERLVSPQDGRAGAAECAPQASPQDGLAAAEECEPQVSPQDGLVAAEECEPQDVPQDDWAVLHELPAVRELAEECGPQVSPQDGLAAAEAYEPLVVPQADSAGRHELPAAEAEFVPQDGPEVVAASWLPVVPLEPRVPAVARFQAVRQPDCPPSLRDGPLQV
jgi:hypothetical protein